MKKLILWIFIFACQNAYSQYEYRSFGINDSTLHTLNVDTTIVVSPSKLYFNSINGLNLIHDFSSFISTDEFINDFEIISDNVWYVIIRSRYWGYDATLFKTIDKGVTWNMDSSYYPATQQAADSFLINTGSKRELYQLQKISNDTLVLFVGYYTSAIFYSTDSGVNWQMWFSNQINNYRGLFKCNDDYYLWSLNGDAFQASMFQFESNLFLSPDTNGAWVSYSGMHHPPCYNYDTINCIYPLFSLNDYQMFLFFKNYADSICTITTSVADILYSKDELNIRVYPNPISSDVLNIIINSKEIAEVIVYDNAARKLVERKFTNTVSINTEQLAKGLYFYEVRDKNGLYRKGKVVKE